MKIGDTVKLISDGYDPLEKGAIFMLREKAGKELWELLVGNTTVYIHERDLRLLDEEAANEPSHTYIGILGNTVKCKILIEKDGDCLVESEYGHQVHIKKSKLTAVLMTPLEWISQIPTRYDVIVIDEMDDKLMTKNEFKSALSRVEVRCHKRFWTCGWWEE